jgi:tetratricopeptide (TPR) repeat protein
MISRGHAMSVWFKLPPASARCPHPLDAVRAVLLALGVAVPAGPVAAQPTDGSASVQQAEELYKKDRLLEAEKAYRVALETAAEADRPRCHDRLLAIYIRLGRLDLALHNAARYEDWLRRREPTARLRALLFEQGWCYFTLGHHEKAEDYLRRALEDSDLPPLPAEMRLTALMTRAQVAEQRGQRKQARERWSAVELLAAEQLARPEGDVPPADRLSCVWKLAESYYAQGKHAPAIDRLSALLKTNLDPAARRTTLHHLARHYLRQKDYAAAEKALRGALAAHGEVENADELTRGDLAAALAGVLKRQSRSDDAAAWRDKASEAYRAVLREPRLGRPFQAGGVEAFWKLQGLLQGEWQLRKAAQLLSSQADLWPGHDLIDPALQGEGGRLELALGSLKEARALLRTSVAELGGQTPPNLRELPHAYLNLGTVELMTEEIDPAERLGKKCLDLYASYRLPDDTVVIDAYNLLGTCSAQTGMYAEAIGRYREGLARCEALGRAADSQRCNLLLNVALVHKSQGDLDEATRLCEEARAAYQAFAEPDAPGLAVFHAALANLYLARGRLKEAFDQTEPVLRLCKKYDVERGPLITSARHCRALHALAHGQFAEADQGWRDVLALQEQDRQTLFQPRTLNYLGISAELQGRFEEAEKYLRRAEALQRGNARAFPATHYITLWRLAELRARAGHSSVARGLLDEGR